MIDTIVLDLDGTLVSTTDKKMKMQGGCRFMNNMWIYKRRYVENFVKYILARYPVIIVWSDSMGDYLTT